MSNPSLRHAQIVGSRLDGSFATTKREENFLSGFFA